MVAEQSNFCVAVCRYQQLYDDTLKTRLKEAVMGGMLLGYTQVRLTSQGSFRPRCGGETIAGLSTYT